jgi:hypothetical protein
VKRKLIQILGKGLLILGACWGIGELFVLRTALRSERWPVASGRIVSSTATGHFFGLHECRVDVAYEYEINGTRYSSTWVDFGTLAFSAGVDGREEGLPRSESCSHYFQVRAVLDSYPVGAIIRVHYDPNNPRRAVLQPGLNSGLILGIVSAAILLLAGGVVALLCRSERGSDWTLPPGTVP